MKRRVLTLLMAIIIILPCMPLMNMSVLSASVMEGCDLPQVSKIFSESASAYLGKSQIENGGVKMQLGEPDHAIDYGSSRFGYNKSYKLDKLHIKIENIERTTYGDSYLAFLIGTSAGSVPGLSAGFLRFLEIRPSGDGKYYARFGNTNTDFSYNYSGTLDIYVYEEDGDWYFEVNGSRSLFTVPDALDKDGVYICLSNWNPSVTSFEISEIGNYTAKHQFTQTIDWVAKNTASAVKDEKTGIYSATIGTETAPVCYNNGGYIATSAGVKLDGLKLKISNLNFSNPGTLFGVYVTNSQGADPNAGAAGKIFLCGQTGQLTVYEGGQPKSVDFAPFADNVTIGFDYDSESNKWTFSANGKTFGFELADTVNPKSAYIKFMNWSGNSYTSFDIESVNLYGGLWESLENTKAEYDGALTAVEIGSSDLNTSNTKDAIVSRQAMRLDELCIKISNIVYSNTDVKLGIYLSSSKDSDFDETSDDLFIIGQDGKITVNSCGKQNKYTFEKPDSDINLSFAFDKNQNVWYFGLNDDYCNFKPCDAIKDTDNVYIRFVNCSASAYTTFDIIDCFNKENLLDEIVGYTGDVTWAASGIASVNSDQNMTSAELGNEETPVEYNAGYIVSEQAIKLDGLCIKLSNLEYTSKQALFGIYLTSSPTNDPTTSGGNVFMCGQDGVMTAYKNGQPTQNKFAPFIGDVEFKFVYDANNDVWLIGAGDKSFAFDLSKSLNKKKVYIKFINWTDKSHTTFDITELSYQDDVLTQIIGTTGIEGEEYKENDVWKIDGTYCAMGAEKADGTFPVSFGTTKYGVMSYSPAKLYSKNTVKLEGLHLGLKNVAYDNNATAFILYFSDKTTDVPGNTPGNLFIMQQDGTLVVYLNGQPTFNSFAVPKGDLDFYVYKDKETGAWTLRCNDKLYQFSVSDKIDPEQCYVSIAPWGVSGHMTFDVSVLEENVEPPRIKGKFYAPSDQPVTVENLTETSATVKFGNETTKSNWNTRTYYNLPFDLEKGVHIKLSDININYDPAKGYMGISVFFGGFEGSMAGVNSGILAINYLPDEEWTDGRVLLRSSEENIEDMIDAFTDTLDIYIYYDEDTDKWCYVVNNAFLTFASPKETFPPNKAYLSLGTWGDSITTMKIEAVEQIENLSEYKAYIAKNKKQPKDDEDTVTSVTKKETEKYVKKLVPKTVVVPGATRNVTKKVKKWRSTGVQDSSMSFYMLMSIIVLAFTVFVAMALCVIVILYKKKMLPFQKGR